MYQYPKKVLSTQQLKQSYVDAGMIVSSPEEVEHALENIGYYRLRGYCFHLYDNEQKQYKEGTSFTDILRLYRFDTELIHLLSKILAKIEISLRARLAQSLTVYQDPLALCNPEIFDDKELYWKNQSIISAEIARSNDVFIKHNFKEHEGAIPIWAVVEVMSFGTLSKVIKILKTGPESAFDILVSNYQYKSKEGKLITPSKKMFSSWIQSASTLRNMCAHNSRIYNRAINTAPSLIEDDKILPKPRFTGTYEIFLAIKYLRPSNEDWNEFQNEFCALLDQHRDIVEIARLNFPDDWKSHFRI